MKPRYAITYSLLILLIPVVYGLAFKGLFHRCPESKQPLYIGDSNEPALVIEVVIWLQNEVGCDLIDAEIGPETTRKVNARSILDEPEYFNRQASPYFTKSGAPRKGK